MTETDALGGVTSYTFDALGRVTKTVTPGEAESTNSMGYVTGSTNALGFGTQYAYDALGRVTQITSPDGSTGSYTYDAIGRITSVTDRNGNQTQYVYDGNGNLVSKTDADGYVTEYSYNALDLVSSINYNDGKSVSYQYNKVGELVRMEDWTGVNTFELDLLNQLKKATDHKGNVTQYTYDAVGNQTAITYPDGSVVSNTYDAVYNLTGVKDPENGSYTYVYDNANRPVKLTYPNGWIEEYTYDAEGNLLKTVDTDPFQIYNKAPKTKFEYTYDAEGNLTHEFKRDTDAVEGLKSHTDYTYDALNRLTASVRRTEGYPDGNTSHTYTYDTLGNLVREVGPTQRDVDTYQYNDLNQMVAKEECGYIQSITNIHNFAYTYDKRGNLVKEEEICSPTTTGPQNITIATYLYDETNRMVQGTNKAGEASLYTFNGLGVRVGTELILEDNTHGYTDFHCQTPSIETGVGGPQGPEVVKSDYVVDYTRLNIDQRVLVKSEQDGYDFRYVYGLDKVQVRVTGEGTDWWGQSVSKCVMMNYVHTNRLGSVVNLSDQFGRVTARADYSDWGDISAYESITVDGGFRMLMPELTYATHEYDDVLDMYYAKARMYDADSRRFMAVDPILNPAQFDIKEYITNPHRLNQYIYVLAHPLNSVDLLGASTYNELNDFAKAHSSGSMSSQAIAYAVFSTAGGNPFLSYHQLAQVFTASQMIRNNWGHVKIEKQFAPEITGRGYRRADIVGVKGGSQYVIEVKPRWMAEFDEASYIGGAIMNQITDYYEYLQCEYNKLENSERTFVVGNSGSVPQIMLSPRVVETLINVKEFELMIELREFSRGIIGYEPKYHDKKTTETAYVFTRATKHIYASNVYEPDKMTEAQYVYTRRPANTTLGQDINYYKDVTRANLESKVKEEFLKNGAVVVGSIYLVALASVGGVVVVDAGLIPSAVAAMGSQVKIILRNGKEAVATVIDSLAASEFKSLESLARNAAGSQALAATIEGVTNYFLTN